MRKLLTQIIEPMKRSFSHKLSTIDFDLRQLEILCNVIELKSFSKAAKAVFLAQASVSERIATLERMVGTRLLDRLGREVVPTKAGELLYRHAAQLLDMKKTACLEMQDFLGLKQGEIHMGGSTIPGEYILPKVIGQFREKYPDISVALTIADSQEVENRVLCGELEFGVVGSKSSAKNIDIEDMWEDELVLAVPARHPFARNEKIPPERLTKVDFILRERGSGTLRIIEEYLGKTGLGGIEALNVIARFGSSTAVKEGIKAGTGVSILSRRALDTEVKAGTLKTIILAGLNMTRNFYLIKDGRRTQSPTCRAMLDFLRNARKEY